MMLLIVGIIGHSIMLVIGIFLIRRGVKLGENYKNKYIYIPPKTRIHYKPLGRKDLGIEKYDTPSKTIYVRPTECSYCYTPLTSLTTKFCEHCGNEIKNVAQKQTLSRHIPAEVKREVWRRDMGKCVQCGSNEKLEYDHIIPHSRGGSNTARNIQLLCENCNRSKSHNI